MITPLLATKLHIPSAQQGLVPRPRLMERLDAGCQGKLTLISAPAGFGKTTLVATWLQTLDIPHAWLSLDEGDSDPARFFAYLVTAFQQVESTIGASIPAMLSALQPPEALLTVLVNDAAAVPRPFILVLDDYHLIHALPIHQQMSFLLEHQPAQMHLVLIAREDPPLSLSRLRAGRQIVELRQADLQFSLQETADLLRRMTRTELHVADVASLHQRTEGWIAGLQLVALSIQSDDDVRRLVQPLAGSQRYIFDYLIEEVFQRQPVEMQAFLLQTSILERMCGPLCDALVRDRAGEQAGSERASTSGCEILESLERMNLFIVPLDNESVWYRYHHLFADLLKHRLQIKAPNDVPDLHRRAAGWYADHGFFGDAVHHALAAQDWGLAAQLIGAASESMLKRGETVTLLRWLSSLPKEVLDAEPMLCTVYAWAALLASQLDLAESLLKHAENLAAPGSHFLGQVSAAQAYLARSRGDNQRLIAKSQQALLLLPEADLTTRGLISVNLGVAYWHEGRLQEAEPVLLEARRTSERAGNFFAALTARIFMARTLAVQGRLRQAVALYQELVPGGGGVSILAIAHYDLCTIYYEWNNLAKADEHLSRGLELSLHSDNQELQGAGYILCAFLALARGDPTGALEAAGRAHKLTQDLSPPIHVRSIACHAQLALAAGQLDVAEQWVAQAVGEVEAHPFYRFLGLIRPRLSLARGEMETAVKQLEACYQTASHAGWGYAAIAVRVLQSLAAVTTDAALTFLAEALYRAQPEGYIRTFVDAGALLCPLLREAARRGICPQYVGQVLTVMDREHPAAPELFLTEPLSERERQVLPLLANGQTNQEIARALCVSVNTIKTHLKSIYGKLGVGSRRAAVTEARRLGMIE